MKNSGGFQPRLVFIHSFIHSFIHLSEYHFMNSFSVWTLCQALSGTGKQWQTEQARPCSWGACILQKSNHDSNTCQGRSTFWVLKRILWLALPYSRLGILFWTKTSCCPLYMSRFEPKKWGVWRIPHVGLWHCHSVQPLALPNSGFQCFGETNP